MLATGFAQTGPAETAQFSRDKRICDSCLDTDFSASPIPDFKKLLFRLVFCVVSPLAWIGGLLLLPRFGVHGWSRLLGSLVLAIAAGALVAGILCCVLWLYAVMGDRRNARQQRDEALREAERFYYLALWAGLTNRPAYARRMLAQAKRMGFSELSRLNDLPGMEPVI